MPGCLLANANLTKLAQIVYLSYFRTDGRDGGPILFTRRKQREIARINLAIFFFF